MPVHRGFRRCAAGPSWRRQTRVRRCKGRPRSRGRCSSSVCRLCQDREGLFVASRTDFTVVHGVGGGGGIGRMRGNGKPAYAEARVWQVHRQECDGGASVQFHLLPAQIYNGAGCGRPCGHAGPVIQTVQGLRGRSAAQNSGMAR